MKNIHHSNLVFYITVLLLYFVQPVLGALSQIGLGVFQLIIACIIKINSQRLNQLSKTLINYYWIGILAWILFLVASIVTSHINSHFKLIMLIIPMTIGFYLVIVTYSSTKSSNS